MKKIAEEENFDSSSHTILELDLASFASVKKFATKLNTIKNRPLDRLVCNAAVYQPALPYVIKLFNNFISINLISYNFVYIYSLNSLKMDLKNNCKSII
jgi:NAD(P)-dependent dehydrogenase (short-subunit alcohol dehydrogenase family)